MGPAIEIRGVSKRFRLYRERKSSIKERVIRFGRTPYVDFWALKGISVAVAQGETVGLVGHNGSGKSTLLKCIGGILQPTEGEIRTRGRVASLLELGAGFHPDLTGRENVYLNASIMGMTRREIDARFDEIVAFAELEEFIDNQVKHYSSGMFVRLGFAVAVNVEPDVLLVDEVLSVGDESFQRKCMERVRKFQREGKTIVVVSHSADLIREICSSAVVLDHGHMIANGEPGESIRIFREALMRRGLRVDEVLHDDDGSAPWVPTYAVRITGISMEHPGQPERNYLTPGEPLTIHVDYVATDTVDDVVFALAIRDINGHLVFGTNTDNIGTPVVAVEGTGRLTLTIESVPLLDGTYPFSVSAHTRESGVVYDFSDTDHFEVMHRGRDIGLVALPIRAELAVGPPEAATR